MKKKWTVMFLSLNQNEKTFYIQNVGYTEEDFIKLFKLTKEQVEIFNKTYFNGFEKDISDNELKALLQYSVKNMDVLGVYRINNFYNRDQKVINDMKDNVRYFWSAKGYIEVPHCEEPIVDTHGGEVFNKRDYLFLLEERIRESEEHLRELEKKYELKEKNLNKELENNRISLEKTIEENKIKIKQQNWYIDQTKEAENDYIKAKVKLDKEIERYKKGKEYNDNMIKSLPTEIQNLLNKKTSVQNDIDELNKYLTSLYNNRRLLENEKTKLEDELKTEQIKYNKFKTSKYNDLMRNIETLINSKKLSKPDAISKFETVCKMYILNERELPQFEKDYAKTSGLSEQEIAEILQKYL